MVQERVVTRVTKADGSTVNVRNDELEAFLADNSGAEVVGGRQAMSAEVEIPVAGADEVVRISPVSGRGTRRAAPKARK